MTACDGINQFFKSTQHLGIDFRDRLTPSPRPAQANVDGHIGLLATLSQFAHPSGNGVAGQPCCNSHGRDAAPTQRHRFGRCPMPPHTFVHHRKQRQVLDPNPFDRRCILHAVTIEQNQQADKGNVLNLFFRPALGHIKRLVIYLDNGPKNSGRRTQFLKRMVQFADWSRLEIRLVYYPPYHSKYNPIERCWSALEKKWNGVLLNCLKVVLQCALRMTWKSRHPIVKRLHGEYPDGVRVAAKEMKEYEARLERSATLPKYDITIKPRLSEQQGKVPGGAPTGTPWQRLDTSESGHFRPLGDLTSSTRLPPGRGPRHDRSRTDAWCSAP